MLTTVGLFFFESLLVCLVWVGMVVLNVWLWQKSKAQGNLLMLIGAALYAFVYLMGAFAVEVGRFVYFWFPLFGAILLVWGFYLTVKVLVAANIAALRTKAQQAMHKPGGTTGGTPGSTGAP